MMRRYFKKLPLHRYIAIIFLAHFCCFFAKAQQKNYWQQQTNYVIKVSLNDSAKTLDGFLQLTYTNNSPDTLSFIWFHVWPNAYKNDKSAYTQQSLLNNDTRFYFSTDKERGYINQLNFKVNNVTAVTENHPTYNDVIKLLLPTPLLPKTSVTISTPFFVKLPYLFSRLGYCNKDIAATQWYPKPAVYDANGWHAMPYLEYGEFYSEFGNYEVEIIAPENYIIAATGQLTNPDILKKYKSIGTTPVEKQANNKPKQETAIKKNATNNFKKNSTVTSGKVSAKQKNLIAFTFKQENCHDFAWFASPNYIIKYDTIVLQNKAVDIFSFYYADNAKNWNNSITYAKRGLQYLSNTIDAYAYSNISLVQASSCDGSAGMEYPAIVVVGDDENFESTLVHELTHNWFYGALANNERKYAWMDETFTTYYEQRYEQKFSKPATGKQPKKINLPDGDFVLSAFIERVQRNQPLYSSAEKLTAINYQNNMYTKGVLWIKQLEQQYGKEKLDKAIATYYSQWKFKHPQPADLQVSLEKSLNTNLTRHFNALHSTMPIIDTPVKKQIKTNFLFPIHNNLLTNNISIAPALAYNFYDKVGVGVLLHNYQLLPQPFQFHLAPYYATGSKELNYVSRVSYTIYKPTHRWEIATGLQRFTMNDFTSANNQTITQQVLRFSPSLKYVVYNKNILSKQKWEFAFKYFNITENGLRFTTINTPNGPEDVVNKTSFNRYINQLSITTLDNRILYPYKFNITLHQGDNFVRAGFTGNYYFNYQNRKGGIDARLFAGKFFYTTEKTFIKQFETDRYHLNLSGPKGYEDFTYSNYFIGRNEFEGWMSQQIMQRDGFFKVRTDLLSNKVGKTDDWLLAINVSGEIPESINLFNALPFKLPIKFFADIGTYANAWQEGSNTGRFLYDAGLQLPLAKGLVNIYVPLLYSKVYRDYFKSTLGEKRFWKTISFTIDIQKINWQSFSRDIPL